MTRDQLINAIDSPTVAALAKVFDPRHQRPDKSYGEQIVEILEPQLTRHAQGAPNYEDPSGQRREPMPPHPLDDEKPF